MENKEIKKALIELYLSLNPTQKLINSGESKVNYIILMILIQSITQNNDKNNENNKEFILNNNNEKRKTKLLKKSELCLISYIKDTIETFIQVLAEEKINNYKDKRENTQQEYEALLIKLEKEIRGHIQIEQQLKLYAENLQNNLEEIENENINLKNELKRTENKNISNNWTGFGEKITLLKKEIEINKQILKSYETQNLKLSENERKLKSKLIAQNKQFNEKEMKYINEIDSLKEKIINYEKRINSEDEYFYNQYSSKSQKNIEQNLNKDNNLKNVLNNCNKNIYINSNLIEKKKISRTHRTNKNDNKNHNNQNRPALSASSSMEKIEKYLMNEFAKTQLHFKSKINIISSASKNFHKKMPSPYNNSLVEKGLNNGFYSNNNKLQINDSTLNIMTIKQKKKHNRQKSIENNSKLIRNQNKQETILKSILMSNNNSVFNINIKKTSAKKAKGKNNSNYKKVPYTCSLKAKIRNTGGNKNNINNNFNGKIINNHINIYAHTLRQDNHNVYIKGNNEKSLHCSLRGISGNCSARDYYSNKYNNDLFNFRKNSLGKKKVNLI